MEQFYQHQCCASYSGTPNCSGLLLPGTHICDSGTVLGIPGQLVILGLSQNFESRLSTSAPSSYSKLIQIRRVVSALGDLKI